MSPETVNYGETAGAAVQIIRLDRENELWWGGSPRGLRAREAGRMDGGREREGGGEKGATAGAAVDEAL